MKKVLFLLSVLAPLMAALPHAASAADTCYSRASDGTCLDSTSLPTTGQYTTADQIKGDAVPQGLKSSQAHGTVRLTEATYIFAHNICRWVDNAGTHGAAVFIGLEAKTEWVSFINQPPAGASLAYCCQPATVSICGTSKALPFAVSGNKFTFTGGDSFKAVYTCGTGIGGAAPTQDTSWSVATSGQCAAPEQTYCRNGDKGDATCPETGIVDTHDGGHHGPGGGGQGDSNGGPGG